MSVLQLITGILLALHYIPDINYSYYSVMYIIREVYYGWSLRYIHSNGASFVFIVLFIHIGRGLYYGSYYYNSNSWFSGIIILLPFHLYYNLQLIYWHFIELLWLFIYTILFSY